MGKCKYRFFDITQESIDSLINCFRAHRASLKARRCWKTERYYSSLGTRDAIGGLLQVLLENKNETFIKETRSKTRDDFNAQSCHR